MRNRIQDILDKITNLVISLTTKADLVNGIIPANQLPAIPSQVTVEQNLTSKSTTSVPSIAATASAITSANNVLVYPSSDDFPGLRTVDKTKLYFGLSDQTLMLWSNSLNDYAPVNPLVLQQVAGGNTNSIMSQAATTTAIGQLPVYILPDKQGSIATPTGSGAMYIFNSTTSVEFTVYIERNASTVVGNHYIIKQGGVGQVTITPRMLNGFTDPAPTITPIGCNLYTEHKNHTLHLHKVGPGDNWIVTPYAYSSDDVDSLLTDNGVYNHLWFDNTYLSPISSGQSNYTVQPNQINTVGDGSITSFNITIDTTGGGTNERQIYGFFMPTFQSQPNSVGSYNTLNFANGITVDGLSSIVLYPGDYIVISREPVTRNYKTGAITKEAKACTTIDGGNVLMRRGLQYPSSAIKSAVAGGTFTNGELQGTQPTGSLYGMKFFDMNYRYECLAKDDSNGYLGNKIAWVRTSKV